MSHLDFSVSSLLRSRQLPDFNLRTLVHILVEGVGDEMFEIVGITDHSVSVYKLKFWQLCTLIST